ASATEMIAALGCLNQMVGRSHECDYPPEVVSLPEISSPQIMTNTSSADIDAQIKQRVHAGVSVENAALTALSIYAINIEQLQALRPDVIFTQNQCEVCAVSERDVTQAVQQLTGLAPRIVSLSPYRLSDVWEDVLRVGEALHHRAEAEQLVQCYQQRLNALQATTSQSGSRPRVTILEWLDPLMGSGNWTPELVAYAGGKNVFGEVGQHSPWISWEELQMADPDVLVLAPCGYSIERTLQDLPILQQHPNWQTLQAVRNNRVYAIDGNQYLNRSGPRLVESAELLGRSLWGNQLAIPVDDDGWRHLDS
ncbi:MAG TPA: cobalamin-binding protein, partial [Ktedonobacteraceae bacterium]|nr:cobalamin-binding protein [Ktedonobacteraceae bacterium]